MKWFERLTGKKEAPKASPSVPETPKVLLSREIREGIQYQLVKIENGTNVIAIPVENPRDAVLQTETNCSSCGAKYPGPIGQECEYCGESFRQIFMRILESGSVHNKPQDKDADPNDHSIDAPSGFTKTEADGYTFGPQAQVDKLVAEKIQAAAGFSCLDTMIVITMAVGINSEINRAIILSKGYASFGDGTSIDYLIVGSDVELIFGDDCQVGELLVVSLKSIRTGANFSIGRQREISAGDLSDLYTKYS